MAASISYEEFFNKVAILPSENYQSFCESLPTLKDGPVDGLPLSNVYDGRSKVTNESENEAIRKEWELAAEDEKDFLPEEDLSAKATHTSEVCDEHGMAIVDLPAAPVPAFFLEGPGSLHMDNFCGDGEIVTGLTATSEGSLPLATVEVEGQLGRAARALKSTSSLLAPVVTLEEQLKSLLGQRPSLLSSTSSTSSATALQIGDTRASVKLQLMQDDGHESADEEAVIVIEDDADSNGIITLTDQLGRLMVIPSDPCAVLPGALEGGEEGGGDVSWEGVSGPALPGLEVEGSSDDEEECFRPSSDAAALAGVPGIGLLDFDFSCAKNDGSEVTAVEAFSLDPDFDYDNVKLTVRPWPWNPHGPKAES